MSWSIVEFENNTLKISKELAQKLFKAQAAWDEIWYDEDEVIDGQGFLRFNPDAQEHMDYLSTEPKIVKVLQKAKVKGRVLFCSHEGDNAGSYWGHEFDGKGGYKELVGMPGTIIWEEVKKDD